MVALKNYYVRLFFFLECKVCDFPPYMHVEQWLVTLLLAQYVLVYQPAADLEYVDQMEALSNPGELFRSV